MNNTHKEIDRKGNLDRNIILRGGCFEVCFKFIDILFRTQTWYWKGF